MSTITQVYTYTGDVLIINIRIIIDFFNIFSEYYNILDFGKTILYSEKSLLYCANAQFLDAFLKRVPELSEPYIPTRFWGFSGHIQTIIQVIDYDNRFFFFILF